MGEVTQLLEAVGRGEAAAAERLLALVYAELNRLAAAQLGGERCDHTLTATALVHEAYLRLAGPDGGLSFENRRHFFGAAATAMRRILVDAARRRNRQKRGGGAKQLELGDVAEEGGDQDERMLALDEALGRLAQEDAEAAKVVELRRFAGFSHEQTAGAMGMTAYAVRQKWTYARAWLRDAIEG